jgi:hypothetical protein
MKNSLDTLLDSIAIYISDYELLNTEVSQSNIGWHIEHTLLTINGIVEALTRSNPKDFKPKFSVIKYIVLVTKKIPRGKARVPKVVAPKVEYTADSLRQHLEVTKEKIKQLELISEAHFFEHPYFGGLKKKQTIRFLEIHTNHHLKIIRDIII